MLTRLRGSTMRLTATVTDDEDTPRNDATTRITIVDRTGEAIAGDEWPVTMADGDSDGEYTYDLAHDLDVPHGAVAEVEAELPGDVRTLVREGIYVTDDTE